jgi:hypothetical protein
MKEEINLAAPNQQKRGFILRPSKDARYTIGLEWCGYPERRHVARFCSDWIGQAETREGAEELARQHRAAFLESIA